MDTVGWAIGEEALHEGLDVGLLVEGDAAIGVAAELDVEEVGHVAFVFSFPAIEELLAEAVEDGVGIVGSMEDHDIVDVTAEDDTIGGVGGVSNENAWV